ncbi:MAG: glycosyl hydrolase family 28 protein [Edaphobacter sp.]|uniref:glycoside hydrolase family 28 protein n=1 Tax=Edaphobacter sp. TaxID=1934404 RepID=UPI0023848C6E|nr:glycosyl hydrolase family 28 protein [Edaphobacter sp.]MDE1178015.1 glycosyl hydrolase family 28 protein [Edaphobacter sp.]
MLVRRLALLAAVTCSTIAATGHAATLVVNSFGAKGDGTTVDTVAIQKALDKGAGKHATITFKPGTYLIGSIFVKSGETLNIPAGVKLIGIQKLEAYPLMPTRVAGIEMTWPAALVNVYKQSDVVITGEGTIDGDGSYWWKSYWDLRKIYEPKGLRWASDYDAKRPRLIQVFDSKNVKLDGMHLERSGFWTVHICYSEDVVVDHITIRNNIGGKGPSTDGIDIDSSKKILVQHADIEVNDDALCLKAGRDADGLRVNRPTEDVVIRDSVIRTGAAAVTFGSETSGGFRNIEAYNLTAYKGVGNGVLIKSAKVRGGLGENLRVHDLHLTDVRIPIQVNLNWNPSYSYAEMPKDATDAPPYWKVLTTKVPEDKGIPHFADVHIWNIEATGAKTAIAIAAYPQAKLKDFRIDHVSIAADSAGSIADTDNLVLDAITLKVPAGDRLKTEDNVGLKGLDAVTYP